MGSYPQCAPSKEAYFSMPIPTAYRNGVDKQRSNISAHGYMHTCFNMYTAFIHDRVRAHVMCGDNKFIQTQDSLTYIVQTDR